MKLQTAFDEADTKEEKREGLDEESMELITESEMQNLLLAKHIYEEERCH